MKFSRDNYISKQDVVVVIVRLYIKIETIVKTCLDLKVTFKIATARQLKNASVAILVQMVV